MFKVLTTKDIIDWDKYLSLLTADRKDIYFTPEYYSLYESYDNGSALCFIFEDNGEVALYPFIKNSITRLGYKLDKEYYDIQGAYGYNGLISSTNDDSFINNFWQCFDRYCQENDIVAEFMRFHPLLQNHKYASTKMKIFYSRKTIALDLRTDDIWMHHISSKNRNMIRKAIKEGVYIVESDDYESFRKLYNNTMKDLDANDFYFFPQSYYERYKQVFHEKSFLCFAMYEGEIIAGSMFMMSDNITHYHLSARDRRYSSYAANNLILWYAIQKAKECNCRWFHLGGGTTESDDDSLLKFKKEFSKDIAEFWIGKRIHNQEVYEKIVEQWKINYPESYNANKTLLLGYREI